MKKQLMIDFFLLPQLLLTNSHFCCGAVEFSLQNLMHKPNTRLEKGFLLIVCSIWFILGAYEIIYFQKKQKKQCAY